MASQSRWSKLQSRPLEQAVGVVHHLRQEVVALQEVLEGQEEEVIMVLREVECHWKEGHHLAAGAHHLKDLPLLALSAAVAWVDELHCHVKETAMVDHPAEIRSHHAEMTTCHREMMVTVQRIAMIVILEIMAAPEIQEIMHHLHEIMLIGIMVIQALVTIMDQEVIVIVMAMGDVIEITPIIQVAVLTETLMSPTVTHVVPHLQEAPLHHMVEAVAMMIMAALEMATEAETVTQAAEMICTQVDVTELAVKIVACPLQWIEAIHLHVIHTAAQVGVLPVVAAEAEADLIEEVAEADTKSKKIIKHGPKTFCNERVAFALHLPPADY